MLYLFIHNLYDNPFDCKKHHNISFKNENGMIIPPRDVDALFVAMRRMLNDDRRRSYMASNARNMIGCRFEQGFVRQCLLDFYDTILGGEKE